MSSYRPSLLERAFELAASGEFATLTEIRNALKRENYEAVDPQLVGPTVRRQLRRLIGAGPKASG